MRRNARVHRGDRGRRETGLGACQSCADAFARRRAGADAPPAAGDRQDGHGECERLQIERLDYRFTRATVRQFTGWGDSQLKKHLSAPGRPRISGPASRRSRSELRLRAQLRDGREWPAGVAGVELRRKMCGRMPTGHGLKRGCHTSRPGCHPPDTGVSWGCHGVVTMRNRQHPSRAEPFSRKAPKTHRRRTRPAAPKSRRSRSHTGPTATTGLQAERHGGK